MRQSVVAVTAMLVLSSVALADRILIVNGASSTSESGTTDDITANLPPTCGLHHTYTVEDTPPASLSGYDQIWDLRFDNVSALTASEQAAYLAFLQAGGNMFVMGENSSFMTRNNSIIDFVDVAGGGSLSFVVLWTETQTANPPFNAGGLTDFYFNAAGGSTTPGTGIFATSNANGGSALAWARGTLGNAPNGSLTVVFDVNFMQPSATADQNQFFQNLCNFVETGGGPVTPVAATPVPTHSPFGLLALSALLGFAGWRVSRKPA